MWGLRWIGNAVTKVTFNVVRWMKGLKWGLRLGGVSGNLAIRCV